MAIWVSDVVALAPCQCFSPGGVQITSPGRISSTGPPQACTQPQPAMTINVWPSGCVCQALRAPGSKVTLAPLVRAGSWAENNGSTRTVPVKVSVGPLREGCEPPRLISMTFLLLNAFRHAGVSTMYCRITRYALARCGSTAASSGDVTHACA